MSYEPIDDSGRQVALRKPRRCQWCGEMIATGERACPRVYRFDGDFNDERVHPECFGALRDYFARDDIDDDDGFLPYCMVRGKPLAKEETDEAATAGGATPGEADSRPEVT